MGSAVIRYFSNYGGEIKALSDPKYGGTWVLDGSASTGLITALSDQNTALAISLLKEEGQKISEDSEEALYADVDVLFPCALEDVLHKENAEKVRARFIAEGANNCGFRRAYIHRFKRGKRRHKSKSYRSERNDRTPCRRQCTQTGFIGKRLCGRTGSGRRLYRISQYFLRPVF
jgi:hypothetical protein